MSLNAFADGYNKGYQAGYDDATEDRAALEARVRALEAQVSAARANGRLEELEAIVSWLRAAPAERLWRQEPMDATADALCRGEHLTATAIPSIPKE